MRIDQKTEALCREIRASSLCKMDCELCGGTGEVEIMGDGDNFEWDVVDVKPCECTYD